jgi:hypothetical protein
VIVESARHDPRGVGVNTPVNTVPLYYRVEWLTDLQRGKGAYQSPQSMEVSAQIRQGDPEPAPVVARRWASGVPAASVEPVGPYWGRAEWVARRSPHVPFRAGHAAGDYQACSCGRSPSIVSSHLRSPFTMPSGGLVVPRTGVALACPLDSTKSSKRRHTATQSEGQKSANSHDRTSRRHFTGSRFSRRLAIPRPPVQLTALQRPEFDWPILAGRESGGRHAWSGRSLHRFRC